MYTCRGSIPKRVAISIKACYDSDRLSPILACFMPRLPNTPPPDEPTAYESVLTTPTPIDITDFNEDVTIAVWDVEENNTVLEDAAGEVSCK